VGGCGTLGTIWFSPNPNWDLFFVASMIDGVDAFEEIIFGG
jgi:hypothetical protein